MILLVPVKQVPDPVAPLRFREDGTGIVWQDVKTRINPFDEIALEAAVRFREQGVASQVIAVAIGPESWQESLRTALALGADRAVAVTAAEGLEPLLVAKCLAALAKQEGVTLILAGRQSVDGDNNQTGQMTAALLGWGQATCASRIQLTPDGAPDAAVVEREVDGGLETWTIPLPAVITTDLRLNTPRYASLPNIMKARRKPFHHLTPAQLGLRLVPQIEILSVRETPARPLGKRVRDVAELLAHLRSKGLVT